LDILHAQDASGGGMSFFVPMLIVFVIFYFLLIRPQSKQRKTHIKQLQELKKGDRILTRGGIYGNIVDIIGKEANMIIIDVGDKNKLTVARSYIAGLADSAPTEPENS